MSIEDFSKNLMTNNNTITATAVISLDGSILYQTQNWTVDGGSIINSFKNKEPSLNIQGIKYSTLDVNEDRLIATNVAGQGHIVAAAVGTKALLVAYVNSSGDPRSAYIEVDKTARELAKAI
ncbi:MAG: profilin family protein [Candidatus Odinarchaeia archaeon]